MAMEIGGVITALFGGRRGRLLIAFIIAMTICTLLIFQGPSTERIRDTAESSQKYIEKLNIPYISKTNEVQLALFDQSHFKPKVHLLIPVTRPNTLFCKVMFSALVNSYPPPFLINYNQTYWMPAIAKAAKIKGMRDYLVDKTQDNDIVIMVDGYDAWFQLPLHSLLQRFYKTGAPVVFGADKKCWPNEKDSIACTAPPESPLPIDIYGKDTDELTMVRKLIDKFDNFRPRWVNSGTVVGYASHVRSLYDEAWGKINGTREVHSDQLIMAEVYGERLVRGDHAMTLDYTSSMFQTMTYSHHDIAFIVNPDERTKSTSFSSQVAPGKLELDDLGMDAATQKKWGRRESVWRNRSLAWNKVTNVLPVILHFNGPKEYLLYWWPRMWWNDEGPELNKALLTTKGRAGAVVDGGWLSWEALCGGEDLFNEGEKREEARRNGEQQRQKR